MQNKEFAQTIQPIDKTTPISIDQTINKTKPLETTTTAEKTKPSMGQNVTDLNNLSRIQQAISTQNENLTDAKPIATVQSVEAFHVQTVRQDTSNNSYTQTEVQNHQFTQDTEQNFQNTQDLQAYQQPLGSKPNLNSQNNAQSFNKQQNYSNEIKDQSFRYSVISIILGIVSLTFTLFDFPCSIIGFIFAVKANKIEKSLFSTIGLVTSILGIIKSTAILLLLIIYFPIVFKIINTLFL